MDQDKPPETLRTVVAIATAGRPGVLPEVVKALLNQSCRPDLIHISAPSESDVALIPVDPIIKVTIGFRGSCIQRNVILRDSLGFDVALFLDDDFVPRFDYLEAIQRVLVRHPEIVVCTGYVIADGVTGPGLDLAQARELLQADIAVVPDSTLLDIHNGYGCNMAVRLGPLHRYDIEFDENLPLYGWLEDVDLSRRLARHGRTVKTFSARGVHLGDKRGRQGGKRIGYSQIANPIYLAQKGSVTWMWALRQLARNVLANSAHSFRPEPYVDRRGRLAGHAVAVAHLITGRLDPKRVAEM